MTPLYALAGIVALAALRGHLDRLLLALVVLAVLAAVLGAFFLLGMKIALRGGPARSRGLIATGGGR